jgi:imidazolonepropionase-like amidohydrolase
MLEVLETPVSQWALESARNARVTLEAGVTFVRDLAGADRGIRDALAAGFVPGPRLQISVTLICQTGGHGDAYLRGAGLESSLTPESPGRPPYRVDGTDSMRAAVRATLRSGADWIKLATTGGLVSEHDEPLVPELTREEIEAAVFEAGRKGRHVAAHAYGGEGAKNAVRGGVRSLEHGMMLDDEALRLMVEHGTFYCPTLSVYVPKTPEEDTDLRRRIVASHRQVFQKAIRMGVKIVFGTDVGAFEHGTNAREFELMVEYGMKPIEAVRAATVRAAELLRMEKQLGAVEPGKYADIIAVEGNPLEDIRALRRVTFVMKAGQVYVSPR